MYYASEKKKLKTGNVLPLYNNKSVKEGPGLTSTEIETEIIASQQIFILYYNRLKKIANYRND